MQTEDVLQWERHVLQELASIRRATKPYHRLIWELENVEIITNSRLCRSYGIVDLDVLNGGAVLVENTPLIILNARPDMKNEQHLALLYHEIAHIKHGDVHLVRMMELGEKVESSDYLTRELAADAYAAANVSVFALVQLLLTLRKAYLDRDVLSARMRKMFRVRLSTLGYKE